MPVIFTIGYEGVSLPAVLRALQEASVDTLVDVRDFPGSRRPGFSKTPLSQALAEAGMAYWHLKALGTPKAGRTANKAGRMEEFRQIYAERLATDAAQAALDDLARRVATERCCLLCFEAQPDRCHRTQVLEALTPRLGTPPEITHLLWPPVPA